MIVDADGNSLIDFGAGIAVVSVGNAAPRVAARVAEQADRFTHTCFMVTPYEGYVEVCEELARRTPGTYEKRSGLFNSGAEAVENAVKIARHATGRQAIVAFDHAYHGRTNLTMALTAKNMPYKDKFGPFASEIYRMPMAYPLRWPGGPEACARERARGGQGPDSHPGGRGQRSGRDHRADPGRGRVRRAAGRVPARAGRVLPRARHRVHRR